MKKIGILILFSLMIFLTSCQKRIIFDDSYDESPFGIIDLKKDEIKIMQLTDLHYTYGFDGLDRKTNKLVRALIEKEQPDLVVVTGDLFMSIFAKRLLNNFIDLMDELKTPWAYALGNHESEFHDRSVIANILMNSKSEYLYYHPGPKLSNDSSHGYSNYKLSIYNDTNPILNVYILDTKANRTDGVVDKDFPYDYLSTEQVSWFSDNLSTDLVNSLAFMHIPIKQYMEYTGEANEKVWAQGKDTGFFQAILDNGKKTLGVFSGHDHLNQHEFLYKDILLAYGASSGYNAYGAMSSKGARIIEYNYQTNELETYLVYAKEVL